MSNLKNINELKTFSKYVQDLKNSIKAASTAREAKLYFSPQFVFTGVSSKKAIILIGMVDSALIRAANLIPGKCRTDGKNIEILQGIKPDKVQRAILDAGLMYKVTGKVEEETEAPASESGHKDAEGVPPMNPAMAKKVAFEEKKFEERSQAEGVPPMNPAMARKVAFEEKKFEERTQTGSQPAPPAPSPELTSIAKRLQELTPVLKELFQNAKNKSEIQSKLAAAAESVKAKDVEKAKSAMSKLEEAIAAAMPPLPPVPDQKTAAQTAPPPASTSPPPTGGTAAPQVSKTRLVSDLAAIDKDLTELYKSRIGGDLKIIRNVITQKMNKNDIDEAAKLFKELKIKADFIRRREKKVGNRRGKLSEYAAAVEVEPIAAGTADALIKDKSLKADAKFGNFTKALKAYEGKADAKTMQALKKSVAEYETYFDKLKDADKQKDENKKKISKVMEFKSKISVLEMLETQKALDAKKEWDREDESKAMEVYLQMMLELSDAPPKNLKAGGSSGEMVMRVKNVKDAPKLAVKPIDKEIGVLGFSSGGGASREMLASAAADKLQEMLGIELNAPETRVVSIDGGKIGLDPGKPVTVSAQSWVKDAEQLGDKLKDKPGDTVQGANFNSTFARIPKEEIQNKAIFDLVMLHCDRHANNYMLADDGSGPPKLVPIDHGNTLPTKEGLVARGSCIGPPHAILGTAPAAKEKLSPEQIERIQRLNTDELMASMKGAQKKMREEHPDADKGDLEEGLANSKRSIEFLKFAAADLTLEQIYMAYSKCIPEVFLTDEKEKKSGFEKAVKFVKSFAQKTSELTTIAKTSKGQTDYSALLKKCQALGWFKDITDKNDYRFKEWAVANPQKCAKIISDGIKFTPPKAPATPASKSSSKDKSQPMFLGKPVDKALWDKYQMLGGDAAFVKAGVSVDDSKVYKNLDKRIEVLQLLAGAGEISSD